MSVRNYIGRRDFKNLDFNGEFLVKKLSLAFKIFGLETFGTVLCPGVGCHEHGNKF